MLYLFSNTFDILAVYKNPWEIEAVNNNILNQSTWATQELTNGFGISNEKHVCFMLWKQKLKGHKPCCGRGTQGRALKLRLFDCAPFPVVQVTRYIGDCDDVIVSTDEYLLWLPCHRAWLFGFVVRVLVWHPVDPGSSPGGLTTLSLRYKWCHVLRSRCKYVNCIGRVELVMLSIRRHKHCSLYVYNMATLYGPFISPGHNNMLVIILVGRTSNTRT